jgi:hypothetical protein
MYSKDVVESFCLEIISNANKIRRDAEKISNHDFSSVASKQFSHTLVLFAKAFREATENIFIKIDFSDENIFKTYFQELQYIMILTHYMAEQLHYIEQSKMSKSPVGLLSPLQDIASHIISDVQIILYEMWQHNYAIHMKFNERFQEILQNIQIYISSELFKEIENTLKTPRYLVAFPHIDKKNILQYSLLGHELGHLYVDERLKSFDIKQHVMNDKDIMQLITQSRSKPQALQEIEDIWRRLIEELLSDVVGTVLFGPAMLFSVFEFAIQRDIDLPPLKQNSFYPPWRSRLSLSYEMVKKMLPSFGTQGYGASLFEGQKVRDRIEEIKQIVDDKQNMNGRMSPEIKIIFENVTSYILSILDDVLKELRVESFDEIRFIENIKILTDRLQKGLVPNMLDDLNITSNATLCEILNTAWQYRISWEGNIFNQKDKFEEIYLKERKKLNQLTNKAVEFSDLTNQYTKQKLL